MTAFYYTITMTAVVAAGFWLAVHLDSDTPAIVSLLIGIAIGVRGIIKTIKPRRS